MILCIDPSVRNLGAALFYTDGTLKCTKHFEMLRTSGLSTAGKCYHMARYVADWFAAYPVSQLVFEWPEIYKHDPVPPNDLLGLAGVGMALAGLFKLDPVIYTPKQWTHGSRKDKKAKDPWKSPRGQRIYARLTTHEIKAVVPTHDVIDAVGIGLHHLHRLKVKRVIVHE